MSIIGTTKELIELAKKGATIELELRLVQMQESELELREKIVSLKSEVNELKEKLSTKESLTFANGMYAKGDQKFCQLCWDSEEKLISLQYGEIQQFDEYERQLPNLRYYSCLKCKSSVEL